MVSKIGQSTPQVPPLLAKRHQQTEPAEASMKATEVKAKVVAGSQVSNRAAAVIKQLAKKYVSDEAADKKGLTLDARAQRRKRLEDARKQQNIEAILHQAAEYVDERECQDRLDEDWLYQFFSLAESIFAQPMQALWGKILAMQTMRPGSFSLRALNALKQMTHREALIFQRACALSLKDGKHTGGRIISGCYRLPPWYQVFSDRSSKKLNLSQYQLNYPDLLTLIDLNLLYSSEIESVLSVAKPLVLQAGSEQCILRPHSSQTIVTYYRFTQAGAELATLLPSQLNEQYKLQLGESFGGLLSVEFSARSANN
ncbi:TIGR03899 family protein [Gayadomonas joobiniege]|uniref:TIGR03899 family protein n=1 Tax=Gayadomonas joobiniege TaxID=1234606 RepID=UPI000374091E|nr:TIGR03899 family protein [Gayadomonas joobiniege]